MPVSKTGALPLGDTPMTVAVNRYIEEKMAGVPGFEPGNAGIKNRCLTAWRYPNKKSFTSRRGYLQTYYGSLYGHLTAWIYPIRATLWVNGAGGET